MRYANRPWMSLWGVAALLAGVSCGSYDSRAAVPAADTSPGDTLTGAWQHHKAAFNYVGFTSLYTCSGLEGQVREILLQLGARRDVHVSATGCPGPHDQPSSSAWVNADFYTLAPAEGARGPDAVNARWTALSVTPRGPGYIGEGACELIQGMKDLITKNFTLRDIDYRTDCFPHQVTLDSFAVKGQALRAMPQDPHAVTSRPITGRPVAADRSAEY